MGLTVVNNGETESLRKVKKIVAIAAGKGGVGKSATTVNLALALTKLGFKVGILDADVYGPSIRKMLGEGKEPFEQDNWMIPAYSNNIKHISLSFFTHVIKSSVVRAPIANNVIEQFIHKTMWGELDFLLVDFPPGTGDIQLTLMQQMPFNYGIAITTPQQISLIDVEKAVDMFIRMNVQVKGIIENMSYYQAQNEQLFPFGKGAGEQLAKHYGVSLLAKVPIDEKISQAMDEGKTIFDEQGPVQEIFLDLSRLITEDKIESAKQNFTVEWHLNRKSFVLTFNDGLSIVGRARELQQMCPCIKCQSVKEKHIDPETAIHSIESVGNYALKFSFTKGCSKGIYTFNQLKKL